MNSIVTVPPPDDVMIDLEAHSCAATRCEVASNGRSETSSVVVSRGDTSVGATVAAASMSKEDGTPDDVPNPKAPRNDVPNGCDPRDSELARRLARLLRSTGSYRTFAFAVSTRCWFIIDVRPPPIAARTIGSNLREARTAAIDMRLGDVDPRLAAKKPGMG